MSIPNKNINFKIWTTIKGTAAGQETKTKNWVNQFLNLSIPWVYANHFKAYYGYGYSKTGKDREPVETAIPVDTLHMLVELWEGILVHGRTPAVFGNGEIKGLGEFSKFQRFSRAFSTMPAAEQIYLMQNWLNKLMDDETDVKELYQEFIVDFYYFRSNLAEVMDLLLVCSQVSKTALLDEDIGVATTTAFWEYKLYQKITATVNAESVRNLVLYGTLAPRKTSEPANTKPRWEAGAKAIFGMLFRHSRDLGMEATAESISAVYNRNTRLIFKHQDFFEFARNITPLDRAHLVYLDPPYLMYQEERDFDSFEYSISSNSRYCFPDITIREEDQLKYLVENTLQAGLNVLQDTGYLFMWCSDDMLRYAKDFAKHLQLRYSFDLII
jgi:hypothetical protein